MLSSQSSYLNCISIILNIYLNLLSKSDTKVDLPSWFVCVVLFSKCQSKDGIERKDSDKPHGTPRVPKEELRLASVGRRRVSWVVWDWISYSDPTYLYRFWPVASAFLPLPIQLLSLICITTLDGSIAQCFLHLFAYLICLLFHLLLLFAKFCIPATCYMEISYFCTHYRLHHY